MDEAIALLDSMASAANQRTIFTADQVMNWCLDIRNALTSAAAEVPQPTAVG